MSGVVQDPPEIPTPPEPAVEEVFPPPPQVSPSPAAVVDLPPYVAPIKVTKGGGVKPSALDYLKEAGVWGMRNWKTTVSGAVAAAAFLLSHQTVLSNAMPARYHPALNTVVSVSVLILALCAKDGGRADGGAP